MQTRYNVLVLGASYGSLFATKSILAGHDVTLVCTQAEVDIINREGTVVILPVRGREQPVRVSSNQAPGKLSATTPDAVDPAAFDLVVLAMQEPQYGSAGIRELMPLVGKSGIPCLAIMNMPPLPYLKRISGLDTDPCRNSYADATVWDGLDPDLMTLCSPDPQAFRPPDQPVNVLQVRLPTNFKSARFSSDSHTALLRRLEADILASRFEVNGEALEIPVKLRVHESLFVPMAKWCMLIAGNYRCVGTDEVRPIRDAVHDDLSQSRAIYDWVADLCVELGANGNDMVPFDKYADAARSLVTPSSAARALAAGAPQIERVDRLVQTLGAAQGRQLEAIDGIVSRVDGWLERNRAA